MSTSKTQRNNVIKIGITTEYIVRKSGVETTSSCKELNFKNNTFYNRKLILNLPLCWLNISIFYKSLNIKCDSIKLQLIKTKHTALHVSTFIVIMNSLEDYLYRYGYMTKQNLVIESVMKLMKYLKCQSIPYDLSLYRKLHILTTKHFFSLVLKAPWALAPDFSVL